MMIDHCTWDNPGHEPYVGTPSSAIHALGFIPVPVRRVLVERAERHDFDDVVYIDRDSIQGKRYAYAPEVSFMAFGAHGKVCADVTRTKWRPEHVESAIVICEQGWCVARPSVCNNWSVVVRLARREPPAGALVSAPPEALLPPESVVAQGPGPEPLGPAPVLLPNVPQGDDEDEPVDRLFPPRLPGLVFLPGVPFLVVRPVVTPVPEPTVLWLLIVGLVAVAWLWRGWRGAIVSIDDDGPEEFQALLYCAFCCRRLNDPEDPTTREVEPQTCTRCFTDD